MGCWVCLETQIPFHFLLNLQWALASLRCWHLPIACGQGWLLCTRFFHAYERAWNTSLWIPTFGFRYCLYIVLVESSKQKQILYTRKCVYVCVHHLWKWHVNHRYVSMDILTVSLIVAEGSLQYKLMSEADFLLFACCAQGWCLGNEVKVW